MFKHLLLTLAVVFCVTLSAQESQYPWEFGLQLGTSSLGGDLTDNTLVFFSEPQFSGGLVIRRRLGSSFALRGSLMYGGLNSTDLESEDQMMVDRGFTSEATVIEPGLGIEWEPLASKRFNDDFTFNKIISPYLWASAAYGIWGDVDNTYGDGMGAGVAEDMREKEDNTGGFVVPVGVGLKFYVSPKTAINLDASYRIVSTNDYIDGVSASGDADDNDAYTMLHLGFTTGFGARDADGDGVMDDDDLCPTEAGPASTMGCPDQDGDGVADKDDECPEIAGLATLAGCPDGDGDGVADKDDACPTEAGLASLMGCPDGDGDGIADKDDECPTEAGLAALNGCPDGDGDGIADKDDECPAEAGPAALNGCPDRDGDGIADKDDECPDEAGVAERNGCPLPVDRPENLQERITRYSQLIDGQDFQYIMVDSINGTIAINRIYFPTDVSSLNRPDRLIIEEIDRFIALPGAENFSIRYEGHADRRASDAYNQRLSERRATSAETYTVREGGEAAKLSTIGFGENQPVGETLRENRVVIPVATEPTRMVPNN